MASVTQSLPVAPVVVLTFGALVKIGLVVVPMLVGEVRFTVPAVTIEAFESVIAPLSRAFRAITAPAFAVMAAAMDILSPEVIVTLRRRWQCRRVR